MSLNGGIKLSFNCSCHHAPILPSSLQQATKGGMRGAEREVDQGDGTGGAKRGVGGLAGKAK